MPTSSRGSSQGNDTVSTNGTFDQLLPLAEQAATADRFDLARQWADLAHTAAQKSHDAARVAAANSRARDISAAEVKAKLVARSVAALKANPNDPEANLAVGVFRCVEKDDWQSGLPLLSHGSDAVIEDTGRGRTEITDRP